MQRESRKTGTGVVVEHARDPGSGCLGGAFLFISIARQEGPQERGKQCTRVKGVRTRRRAAPIIWRRIRIPAIVRSAVISVRVARVWATVIARPVRGCTPVIVIILVVGVPVAVAVLIIPAVMMFRHGSRRGSQQKPRQGKCSQEGFFK